MTDEKTIDLQAKQSTNLGKFALFFALFIGLLILLGFVLLRQSLQQSNIQSTGDAISVETLEDQYGIRVNLLAVTAANGLVDLRLKVLDAEKAKLLLQDSNDIPSLLVGDGSGILAAPEDSASDLFNSIEDDGNIFLMFPNTGNIVKPNTLVTVQFGDVHLEPIIVQ